MPAHLLYDPAQFLPEIHAWIESGQTLRAYCRQDGKPSYGTVYDWLEEIAKEEGSPTKESSRFAHARDLGEAQILQECMEIADNTQIGDIVTTKPVIFEGCILRNPDGSVAMQTETKTADMIEHRKLRIDTRLKLLAKWNPKKYGERIQTELSGELAIKRVISVR